MKKKVLLLILKRPNGSSMWKQEFVRKRDRNLRRFPSPLVAAAPSPAYFLVLFLSHRSGQTLLFLLLLLRRWQCVTIKSDHRARPEIPCDFDARMMTRTGRPKSERMVEAMMMIMMMMSVPRLCLPLCSDSQRRQICGSGGGRGECVRIELCRRHR